MNIDAVAPEPGPKRKPIRSFLIKVPGRIWGWFSSRRTARALAANKAAVIAVTTSVAAAGVGGYATVQANQAQHAVGNLAARLNGLQADLLLATAQMDLIRTNVLALDRKSAKQLHALRVQMNAAGVTMDRLAAQVKALPPTPDLAPLASRVSKLAAATSKTAKLALEASTAAADQHDPEARHQAELAADAAGTAGAAARDAQKTADEAKAKAEAALNKPDPVQTPGYQPFPRYINLPDLSTTVVAIPVTQSFTVDLPSGDYAATLQVDFETGPNVNWYVQLSTPGTPADTSNATGTAKRNAFLNFTASGGTKTFTAKFDALTPVVPPGQPITGTWRVVIEKAN